MIAGPVPPGENDIASSEAFGEYEPSALRVSVLSMGVQVPFFLTRTGRRLEVAVNVPLGFAIT
ncbi:hypothetical protein GCM10009738_11120 [Kitasatospora viridis]